MIKNTILFVVVECVCICITYQIKKCVCINVCVCLGGGGGGEGGCLDKYISAATWPPKQKFLAPPLTIFEYSHVCKHRLQTSMAKIQMHD